MQVVFLINGYNTFDTAAPLLHRLLIDHGDVCDITLVSYYFRFDHDDYRLKFLKSVGEFELVDTLSRKEVRLRERAFHFEKMMDRTFISRAIYYKFIHKRLQRWVSGKISKFDLSLLPIDLEKPCSLLVPYAPIGYLEPTIKLAQKYPIKVIAYPSGVRVMEHREDMPYAGLGRGAWLKQLNAFDALLSSNENFTKSLAADIKPGLLKTVGSPRFSAEWSDILDEITPRTRLTPPKGTRLTIVFMLNRWRDVVWKEAILRAIDFLSNVQGVFLVIKPHTTGKANPDFPQKPNVYVAEDHHSRELIDLADVVLFLKSSIFVDALLKKKPVLHMRYMVEPRLSCRNIMKNWYVDSLEDLADIVQVLLEDNKSRTYDEEERDQCLRHYVGNYDSTIIDQCLELILSEK